MSDRGLVFVCGAPAAWLLVYMYIIVSNAHVKLEIGTCYKR
jgi:hypothetical protein